MRVRDAMTHGIIGVRDTASLAEAVETMLRAGISALCVFDERKALVGILSEGDLMRPFGQANAMRRAWWLELLAEGTQLAPAFLDYIKLDRRRAQDLMVAPVVTVPETATLPEIADLLAQRHIKRVPVLRGDRLVGIVSRADVVGALARMPVPTLADL